MVVGRAAVCTTLAGAAGGCTGLMWSFWRNKVRAVGWGHLMGCLRGVPAARLYCSDPSDPLPHLCWCLAPQAWDLLAVCNGVLCGFVAVTAGCHVLEPWAAIIDGVCADIVFELMCMVFLKLKIDDPLSAAPMHGFAGITGLIMVGGICSSPGAALCRRQPLPPLTRRSLVTSVGLPAWYRLVLTRSLTSSPSGWLPRQAGVHLPGLLRHTHHCHLDAHLLPELHRRLRLERHFHG